MPKNFVSYGNAENLMTGINTKKDDKPTTITWAAYNALTPVEKEGKHFIITGAPKTGLMADDIGYGAGTVNDALTKLLRIEIFNIEASDWVANTDPNTSTDYPYIYEVSTTLYEDSSVPIWDLLGLLSELPTALERDSINFILEADFSSTGIILYASDIPTVDLRLRVKGI